MQKNAMVSKPKIQWDGVEIAGLVSVGEVPLEKATVDVPEFKRIRKIQSDVTTVPAIELKYRTDRGTGTLEFFQQWYDNNEVKDGTKISTDASGAEYSRFLWSQCEILKIAYPAEDLSSLTYANITVTILPYEVIPLSAE